MSMPIKLSSHGTREFWEIPVLFEDEHLLAIDKPGGLLTNPDPATPDRPSLMGMLHAAIEDTKPSVAARSLSYVRLAYHLDPETTGVLLVARSKPVFTALADQLSMEKPLLTFIALVQGTPAEQQFEVNAPLGPHPVRSGLMRIDHHHGKKARTLFEVVETFGSCTLVACRPLTLRPHQLRVHLKYAGHPVVGDRSYGGKPLLLSDLKQDYRLKPNREEHPLIAGPNLHCESLNCTHPVVGEPLSVAAPIPKVLTVALKYLRKFGRKSADSRSQMENGT